MKTFVLALFLALPAAAHAADLAQPVSYFSPICGYAPVNVQTVNGFSADGNYVLVEAKGYTTCGNSGRDGGISHVYWCDQLTFDLSGRLVSKVALKPATYAGYNTCPWADPHAVYSNSGGYQAFSNDLNYNSTLTVPMLQSP